MLGQGVPSARQGHESSDGPFGPVGEELPATLAVLALPGFEVSATNARLATCAEAVHAGVGAGISASVPPRSPSVSGGDVGASLRPTSMLDGKALPSTVRDGPVGRPPLALARHDVLEQGRRAKDVPAGEGPKPPSPSGRQLHVPTVPRRGHVPTRVKQAASHVP